MISIPMLLVCPLSRVRQYTEAQKLNSTAVGAYSWVELSFYRASAHWRAILI